MLSNGRLLLSLATIVSLAGPAFCADPPRVIIGGRVCDHVNKPVAGTRVKLKDGSGNLLDTASTDSDGRFQFRNPDCATCSLEVIPPLKKALETAVINGIPGHNTRQFAVRLEHGFYLRGRVSHGGKGLKGLTVQALPADLQNLKGTIHGGGAAVTGADGRFSMVLTPGQKRLTVYNDRYREFTSKVTQNISVIADKNMPDIELHDAARISTGK